MNTLKTFDALDEREKRFVLAYLANNCVGWKAAKEAGYGHENSSYDTHNVQAVRLLHRATIRAALDEMRQTEHMGAIEVLQRHSEIARVNLDDCLDEEGRLDLKKARSMRKMHLVKSITTRTYWDKGKKAEVTEVTVTAHNAQAAQATLMKYHGLLADVIAVKKLPDNAEELAAMLRAEVERTTGLKVPSAADLGGKGN